jgi:hypothetical protein
MAMKYTQIFHPKAFQNIPQIGIFGVKIQHLATLLLKEKVNARRNQWTASTEIASPC